MEEVGERVGAGEGPEEGEHLVVVAAVVVVEVLVDEFV